MIAPHPPLERYYGDASRRQEFVRRIFDETAPWYDWTVAFMSLGTGDRYRAQALARAQLAAGMRVLDLATGTGVVARSARATTTDIIGADPSIGMLRAGNPSTPKVGAAAERLPFANASFDFITIGFALRHFTDLGIVFNECRRVLRPGGRVLILEITTPRSKIGRTLLGTYMGGIVPLGVLAWTRNRRAAQLMRYYWETTRDCVRPEVIIEALRRAGFADVQRHVELGVFSEYTAVD